MLTTREKKLRLASYAKKIQKVQSVPKARTNAIGAKRRKNWTYLCANKCNWSQLRSYNIWSGTRKNVTRDFQIILQNLAGNKPDSVKCERVSLHFSFTRPVYVITIWSPCFSRTTCSRTRMLRFCIHWYGALFCFSYLQWCQK